MSLFRGRTLSPVFEEQTLRELLGAPATGPVVSIESFTALLRELAEMSACIADLERRVNLLEGKPDGGREELEPR